MNPSTSSRRLSLVLVLLAIASAGCDRDAGTPAVVEPPPPGASTNESPPAPPAVLSPDASNAIIERAAPPTLQPVALGEFEPGNPVAVAVTGAITIDDARITGANGASFVTERVAIVRGGDEYMAGQRYADIMMVAAEQPVELRRVVEETPPGKIPDNAMCSRMKTGYIALASVMEGGTQVVKVIGLQGSDLPAATAQGIELCAATHYIAMG